MKTKIKQVRRIVSNDELKTALSDPKVIKRINSVASKYKNTLDRDIIDSASLIATWRCLQYHNDSYGNNFRSSLYNFLHFEFTKEIRNNIRYNLMNLKRRSLDNKEFYVEDNYDEILEYLHILPDKTSNIITQKYIENRSIKEIAVLNGLTPNATRKIIANGINEIKQIYTK